MRHPASGLRGHRCPGGRGVRRSLPGTLCPSTVEGAGEPLGGTHASEVWGEYSGWVAISVQPILWTTPPHISCGPLPLGRIAVTDRGLFQVGKVHRDLPAGVRSGGPTGGLAPPWSGRRGAV